jgi:hypothetical protein
MHGRRRSQLVEQYSERFDNENIPVGWFYIIIIMTMKIFQ